MKKSIFIISLGISTLALTASCGNKENKEGSDTDSLAQPSAPTPRESEGDMERTYSAKIQGNNYSITISRKTDKSLPTVKDDLDTEFYDNSVTVKIARNGGEFYSKTFTKEAFKGFLTDGDYDKCVLNGMAYDEEKSGGGHICIAAMVGQPGLGEGHAFTLDIPTDGSTASIVKAEQQQDAEGPQE